MNLADRWHSAILKNSLDLMRYDAGLRTDILAMINQLGRDLVSEIAGAGLDTVRTDWQRARLRDLITAAEDRISGTFTDINQMHSDGLGEAIKALNGSLTLAMNDAVGFSLLQGIKWTPEQLAALVDGSMVNGAPSEAWWARQSVDLQNAFGDQMRQGMLRGETITQLRDRVLGQDLPGIGAAGKVDLRTVAPEGRGLIQTARRNAEALVRTSAMAANNAAHMALYEANSDVIAELSWSSTLDHRTCIICGHKDGQQWPLNTAHEVPPVHFSCRCVVVPLTKTFEQLANRNKDLARKLDDMPTGLRSSMGGPVSADTTWESWVQGLDKADQTAILGPARQKLWDAGKLSLSDLTDQRGNALTLAELGAKGQPVVSSVSSGMRKMGDYEQAAGKARAMATKAGGPFSMLSDEKLVAINQYTSGEYSPMNEMLWAGKNDIGAWAKYSGDVYRSMASTLNEGLGDLPKFNGPVWRGESTRTGWTELLQPGEKIEVKGFWSASAERKRAFKKPVMWKITSKTGRDISAIARSGSLEAEVLFPSGSVFQIISRAEINGITMIEAVEL